MTTDFTAELDEALAVAIQSDRKIVAAGGGRFSGTDDFALARYNADGSLDPAFGGDGRVTTDFGSHLDVAQGVAVPGGHQLKGSELRGVRWQRGGLPDFPSAEHPELAIAGGGGGQLLPSSLASTAA